MKKILNFCLLIIACKIGFSSPVKQKAPEMPDGKPDFGVILNDDGDFSFMSPDPALATSILQANVDATAALGIKTYVFCVGAGSGGLYYPTKAGSEFGWRKTKYEDGNDSDGWRARTSNARQFLKAGLSVIKVAGDEAKKNGMLFIPSMRMNDDHFMFDPFNYPLTPKFWLDNYNKFSIKNSPVAFSREEGNLYGNLLDYSHPEVRSYMLAIINEVIDLNKNRIDGFELDFNRVQVFFPKNKSLSGYPLMTDLVRKVRNRLNEVAKEQRKPMYLFVRIPPSEDACKWAGLDIRTWIKEKLVDLVSPSQLMTLAYDMPIDNLIKMAQKYGVQMYPSFYPRTGYRVPFIPSANDLGMGSNFDRNTTLSETLAAAANYRLMGVDGYYLFNYYGTDQGSRPYPNWMYALVASLKQNMPNAADKVFAITKTYYHDDQEPSYSYVKQLPRQIKDSATFNLIIGELPAESPFTPITLALRLGLRNLKAAPSQIWLNGKELEYWRQSDHSALNKGNLPQDMAQFSFIYAINDVSLLRPGNNKIHIVIDSAFITDVEIGYAYYNKLNSLMLGEKPPRLNSN